MAYHDSTARIVLFGGVTDFLAQATIADTWEWDGIDWVQRSPAHLPFARSHHTLVAFDAPAVVFLHGGRNIGGDLADTWSWNGADWQEELPSGVARSRSAHAAFAFRGPLRTSMVIYESAVGTTTPQTQELTSGALYETYRQSCAGSCGTPTLSAVTMPRVGQNFVLRVDQICPNSIFFLFFTLDDRWLFQNPNMPLPFHLGVIGAPGCFINVDTAHRQATVMHLVEQQGRTWFDVMIGMPNTPVVLGFEFYNQVAVIDSTANALGIATTNAGHGIVGY